MQPPMNRPMQPPMYIPPQQDYYHPGKKRRLPKKPVVQINIGMQQPQPYGYTVPQMMPHGPKRLVVPGRGYKDPVGEIIDFVADPIGFMVEKSLGLRSNKPKTEKKEGEDETKKGEGAKEEKKEAKEEKKEEKEEKNENENEATNEKQKEVAFRARKIEVEEKEEPDYEEVEYKGEEPEQDQIQQDYIYPGYVDEALCPECTEKNVPQNYYENICPECKCENICPECKGENICPGCKGENICPECNNKLRNKSYKVNQFNNFNFHEIVATSDNTKSYVVVKKGGVTISKK